jgi:hypothetical protein
VLAADEGDLLEALNPVGLQAVRTASVQRLSHDFIHTDWKDPSEFKGCGPFVADSWRIFCMGLRSHSEVGDAKLQAFLRWLARAPEEREADGDAEERKKTKRKRSEMNHGAILRRDAASAGVLKMRTPASSDRRVARGAVKGAATRRTRSAAAATTH